MRSGRAAEISAVTQEAMLLQRTRALVTPTGLLSEPSLIWFALDLNGSIRRWSIKHTFVKRLALVALIDQITRTIKKTMRQ